jgi:EmrB/QacA subfamily drug resistance transporter
MPALERKWWTLIAVCIGIFMLLLDITVVNVALPDIQRSLHSSFADLQWVVDAYSLTLAAFLLTSGVIGDIYGRRLLFAIGLGIFSVSSLVCGLSTSSLMLNLARGVQGVGGAIMFAVSLALIANAFHGKDRGTAFGAYGAIIGAAVAIGPLVGGAITSTIGWRWIFFVNVPIGVVAVFITLTKIAESKDPHKRRVDIAGFATFSVALFLLVWALVRGNDVGWSSIKTVLPLTAAAVLLVAFVFVELRSRDAMLDLSLFRRPAMIGVSGVAFTLAASIFAMFLYLTLYIQDDLGYGPFQAGLRFLPITLMSFIVAPIAGRLTVRMQSRFLLGTGMALVAIGLALMGTTKPDSDWLQLLPGFIVAGAGIGMVNPVLASSAISVVPPERSGMASGINSTFRQVGIATGIAGLGAIFQSQMESRTVTELSSTPAGRVVLTHNDGALGSALASGQVHSAVHAMPAPLARALTDAYQIAFSGTLNLLMFIGTVIAIVGALGGYLLVRQRDFVVPSYEPQSADGQAPVGATQDGHAPAPSPVGAPSSAPAAEVER